MKSKLITILSIIITALLVATHWFAYNKGIDNQVIEYKEKIIVKTEYVNEIVKDIESDVIRTNTDDLRKWMFKYYLAK